MSFRPILITCACAAALAAAACDGDRGVRFSSTTTGDDDARGVLKVIGSLQCPQTMGSLTRKGSASAGGTVCTYVGRKGSEVSLHLVSLADYPAADVLKAFEDRMSGDLPQAVAEMKAAADAERARAAAAQATAARADADAARAQAEAGRVSAAAASGDHAAVRAPGVQIDADGEDASVHLPGISIDSKGDNASVRIGGFHIDANDDGASGAGHVNVRTSNGADEVSFQARNDSAEVRTRAAGGAVRASWILTQNQPSPAGWRLVGYEARGPAGGPIVVATVRSRDANRGRAFEDAKDLVALNVGE